VKRICSYGDSLGIGDCDDDRRRLARAIYPTVRVLFPNQVIRADDLARTMVDVAVRGTGEGRTLVLENRHIRHLAGRVPSQFETR
jgi:hypothetical protein